MKNLGVLWLVVFISLMGFGITAVRFPLVAEQMGASDFWKTFGGAGVFSVLQLIATPLWGRWSDALGRKPILLLSIAGSVLAYVWLAYADTLTPLILARAIGIVASAGLSLLALLGVAFLLRESLAPELRKPLSSTPHGAAPAAAPAAVRKALPRLLPLRHDRSSRV